MATTVLYRISSGEVLKISTRGQQFPHINTNIFEYLIDPDLPDGTDNRPIIDDQLGPARTPGSQKIAIPGSNLVRDASQAEIDGFEALKVEDDNLQDELGAKAFLSTHKRFRKIFIALLKLIVAQLLESSNVKQNEMIDQWNQYKIDVAAASNLGQIKTAIAALPTITSNLPETATLTTIRNQLNALISKDD